MSGVKELAKQVINKSLSTITKIDFPSPRLEGAIRAGYRIILDRDPDDGGRKHYLDLLGSGKIGLRTFFDELIFSDEAQRRSRKEDLWAALHRSRCLYVRSLPRAERILDLGGSSQDDPRGAMVSMGYPYQFKELTIVDLPAAESHEIYRRNKQLTRVETEKGPVSYRFHSMTEFGAYAAASFDMVFMGQTIEHVTEAEADHVCQEIRRILKPGGYFCFDTPNNRGCRLMQADFINPDHKIEYDNAQLLAKLERNGFAVLEAKGLNYMGESLAVKHFLVDEVARNVGLFADAENCFLLAYVCRKPL